MKFSITRLEQARKSPIEFAKVLKNGSSSTNEFGGYPKSMRWLNAICEYHKSKNISDAFDSIERGFSNRKDTPKHRKELNLLYKSLENYKIETANQKLSLIKSRESINIKTNSKITIGGIIPVIYMKAEGGFSAYFISVNNPEWNNELKFPVIQSYVSKVIFKTDLEEIEVGYINYLTGEFYGKTFTESEIKARLQELEGVGHTISINL